MIEQALMSAGMKTWRLYKHRLTLDADSWGVSDGNKLQNLEVVTLFMGLILVIKNVAL